MLEKHLLKVRWSHEASGRRPLAFKSPLPHSERLTPGVGVIDDTGTSTERHSSA